MKFETAKFKDSYQEDKFYKAVKLLQESDFESFSLIAAIEKGDFPQVNHAHKNTLKALGLAQLAPYLFLEK